MIQPNDVSPKIIAVGAHILVRAARFKLVVSTIAIVVAHELNISGRLLESCPVATMTLEIVTESNQTVISKRVRTEAAVEASDRDVRYRTTRIAAAKRVQTGYLPVVTILLVKANPYIDGFVITLPTIIMPPCGSGSR